MFQQMVHNVGKLAVKIDHFAKTPERSWEFWTINLRVIGQGEATVNETSYAVNTEPTTLIALFGLGKESTIFQAPVPKDHIPEAVLDAITVA